MMIRLNRRNKCSVINALQIRIGDLSCNTSWLVTLLYLDLLLLYAPTLCIGHLTFKISTIKYHSWVFINANCIW